MPKSQLIVMRNVVGDAMLKTVIDPNEPGIVTPARFLELLSEKRRKALRCWIADMG